MSNLIFRGEDLLLGDHGQPNQTLGREENHMKAWDDNFVTDTGTAHDGTTMALSLSFLCLLSTVLPHLSVFADCDIKYNLVPPKCDLNRSKNHEMMLILFSICLGNQGGPFPFHNFHFQFCYLLKKGDKKRHISFDKEMDG